jgi:hypothetical protein
MFLRRFEQLRPQLFPIQSMAVCRFLYQDAEIPGHPSTERYCEDPFYQRSYQRGVEWLSSLPVGKRELVYVARVPDETFIVEWQEFVTYWDAYYCDWGCAINTCDDSLGWFLFMHPEHYAVFGCKPDYAADFDLSRMPRLAEPIDYLAELKRLRDEYDHFRKSLVAAFHAGTL